jgi:hypothetical protein
MTPCPLLTQLRHRSASVDHQMSPEQIAETQELEDMGKPKPEKPQLQAQSGWLQRLFGLFR